VFALPARVTFSRNVFVPVTNICRNACGYCGFRRDIADAEAQLMAPAQVETMLRQAKDADCTEAAAHLLVNVRMRSTALSRSFPGHRLRELS